MTQPPSPRSAATATPSHEAARVAALKALEVMDSAPEPTFDDLVWLASQFCEAPIALVSLVDENRQWFKASCGLLAPQTPREFAFCAHALASTDILEVPNALADSRFANNPLVLGEPHIRFYAGAPLVGRAGHIYGTLCVIDQKPRRLSDRQRDALGRLSRQVVSQLEARQDRREAQVQASTLSRLLEAMPDAVVSYGPDGLLGEFNHAARAWHGTDPRSLPAAEWAEHFDLFDASGNQLLAAEHIPLLAAWRGENVRGFELVIKASGQLPRTVLCNASPLVQGDGTPMGAVCVMHDVTALRTATRAAAIAAQRFSGAFVAATHGIALVSPTGRWVEVNDALCSMLGYTREELLHIDVRQLTHPDDLTSHRSHVDRLLRKEAQNYQLSKRYLRKDGATVWAHLAVSLVRDELGQPLHFVAQIQNVTEQRKLEQQMALGSARLERALAGAQLGLWELDIAQMTLQVDARGAAMLGFGDADVIKTVPQWNAVLHPHDQAVNVDAFRRHLRGETDIYENEFRVQAPGGHWIWLFSRGKVIKRSAAGDPATLIGTFMDVTQRKNDEEALARAAMLLRQSGAMARVGGWTLDVASGEAAWTDEVYRIHDLEPQGSPDLAQALAFYTETSRPLITSAVERCISDGTPWDLELELLSAKGRHLWVRAQGEPVYQDGEIVRLSGAFQDITERKQSQLQLQRLNATLAELSYTDALTGLGNRRLFDEALGVEWSRARRQASCMSLLMIDIDHFKHYNDVHGHPAGDECLRQVGAVLQGTLFRAHEKPMRYGGEEFVVLLPDTTGDEAQIVAQRVLAAFEQAAIAHGASPLGPNVTLSVGVAALRPGPDMHERDLVCRADQALYQAKSAGRARFVFWSE
ncbi:PAS domain S-box protein [Acidovorax sp. SUPP3334]|uniref:PAS domain S-box protein n=1 Tax=Acidovorax sp. SUPP3334 TaxID=2920881 RepID=UPI0023DE2463|nr:PAS domain S-box protein [Acidovorax sp. SUPP3334]GKT22387.1 PAS domain S-box protein [Acidovorax sp. SUPP3334]